MLVIAENTWNDVWGPLNQKNLQNFGIFHENLNYYRKPYSTAVQSLLSAPRRWPHFLKRRRAEKVLAFQGKLI